MSSISNIKIRPDDGIDRSDLRDLLECCEKLAEVIEKTLLFGLSSNLGFQGSSISNQARLEAQLSAIQDIINRISVSH